MLEDEALTEPAFAAIAAGHGGRRAWATPSTPRSPATRRPTTTISAPAPPTCKDIRDRVLRALTGDGGDDAARRARSCSARTSRRRASWTDWSRGGGIALSAGSPASHVAMLARARGVPMVVGLGASRCDRVAGLALLDAEHGGIVLEPDRQPTSRRSAAPRIAYGERRAARR